MIEVGQLRRFKDTILSNTAGGDLFLVLGHEAQGAFMMFTVLLQNGTITKFTDGWIRMCSEVMDG